MSTTHTIQTPTHGRYLLRVPEAKGPHPLLVGFHGYGENAAIHLGVLERTVQDRHWVIVSVQALNRFYTRGDREVVASWMTREDRELAIADNIGYVRAVVDMVRSTHDVATPLVYAGFSQGASMAYRAAALSAVPCEGLVAVGGDIPPDAATSAARLPRVLIGRGERDEWYTQARAQADLHVLASAGVAVETFVFSGGHEWTDECAARAGKFLDAVRKA